MRVAPVPQVHKAEQRKPQKREYYFVSMFMPQDADWVLLRYYVAIQDAILCADTLLNAAAVWHVQSNGRIRLAHSNPAARALLFTDGIVDDVCGRFVDLIV